MTKRETGIKAKRRRDGGGRVSATCVGHDRGPWEKACGRLGFAGSPVRGALLEVKGGERGDAWGRCSAHSAVCTYPSLYAAAAAAAAVAAVAVAGCAYL